MKMSVAKSEELAFCENGVGGGDASSSYNSKIDIRNLLKQFGICRETIEYLVECGVSIDVLKKMRISDVDALFPGLQYFGQKIIFRESWIEWRNCENIPIPSSFDRKSCTEDSNIDRNTNNLLSSLESWSDTTSTIAFPNLLDIPSYEFNSSTSNTNLIYQNVNNLQQSSNNVQAFEKPRLQDILRNSIRGRRVLNHYKKYECLNPDLQKDLTHVIIDSFEIQDIWLNTKDLEFYANQIQHLFPTERSDIYFRKRTSRKNPTGKLYDRQVNARQKKKEKEQGSNSGNINNISTIIPNTANNMTCLTKE